MMINSICIKNSDSAQFALQQLKAESSCLKSRSVVFDTILKLFNLSYEYVQLNDLLNHVDYKQSTVANAFTFLTKLEYSLVEKTTVDSDSFKKNVKIIDFKKISDIDFNKDHSDLPVSSSSSKKVSSFKEDDLIPHPKLTDEFHRNSKLAPVLPYPKKISNLISCGNSVVQKLTSREFTETGEPYTNVAQSPEGIGIMNDDDWFYLDKLIDLTDLQISLRVNKGENVKVSSDITFYFRMVDILYIAGKTDNGTNRLEISKSIQRIRHSTYDLKNEDFTSALSDKYGTVTSSAFSFINDLRGRSFKGETIDESTLPYNLIEVKWCSEICNYFSKKSHRFIASLEKNLMPPMFFKLYLELRVLFFSPGKRHLKDKVFNNNDLTLSELVNIIWTQSANDKSSTEEVVLLFLKKFSERGLTPFIKRKDSFVNSKQVFFELDLMGFKFEITIENFKYKSRAINLQSKVYILPDEKEIIRRSGARYNKGRNNVPVQQNPYLGLLADNSTEEPLRIVFMDVAKAFKFESKRSEYYIKINLPEIGTVILTKYHDEKELNHLYTVLSASGNVAFSDVQAFFTAKIGKLKYIKNLSYDDVTQAVSVTGLSKKVVLEGLIGNMRSVSRLKREGWSGLSEMLTNVSA